ncbi:ABC transporter ATP-binding protein [candidate division WOR-1 bacterium RIFOXYD2_FULL_36_8]|uniref:ABC transporter ATP-binding protein n=1 Tax=candidate division WOR-1 bacterium RIFOXYB2_FULL_36_35 TaxID=1802578 RepID=A0A1F4S5T8_UNCSA|nr:MAG: ABC transporter ATP-binding protein [candidate division WOR-1 bacterium RIFOXYA2_FULL_36_21]OGC15801.1 MAG: ABC transporter ATP-binding protein [candidate division WOR-1 bacterium RIFOXYB2_FULL_36_35]OGC16929.1 MAG: ABC transporter ATP-binding protein [candidate division WOR-1 bacterium RIFOXYA12_FULL_36_13]OGC41570.1 MAG: ABC transporter ATP-binding protein [candidate division WOR-1 bacterium RIFOXYD2_FULL_36_8]
MLQINNLSLSFCGEQLFDDISFNIHSGERIGIVGRNGSGKTTLFKLITGEIHPDSGSVSTPKNYTVGYLKQHLNFTESTILEEASLGLKKEDKDQIWKAEKILNGLGFSQDEFHKSPAEFSGGFQVRLNLAKVLLAEPHLLLLDEPTNYLDILSIRWLTRFLARWENELMIITHDRDFMNSVTTHTIGIHRQKVKKIEGDTIKFFEQITVEEEVYEKTRRKEDKKREETIAFINKFRAQAARASLVQSRIKALEKMGKKEELRKISELGFKFNSLEFEAKNLMNIENLSFGYSPERTLIKNLSLHIGKNDRICVVGKNGKGKSTLLRLLAGELNPNEGKITNHPNCKIGYFGQTNIERLNPSFTIEQEFSALRPDLNYTDIRRTCGVMMFSGNAALKKIAVLSGGEKSRVSLGKILLNPTNMLLLDEPTNHLDVEACDSMITALDEFPGAVIIVTHSEMFLHHLAKKLIVFNEDHVSVFNGTYQDFLDRVGWKEEEKKPKKAKKEQKQNQKKSEQEYHKRHKELLENVKKIEKNIDNDESVLEAVNLKIANSFGKLRGEEIAQLQIKSHKHKQDVDEGYKKLETLIAELDELDKLKPL